MLNTPPQVQILPLDFVNKIPIGQFEKIIFVSSTSVFGQNKGTFSEANDPLPVTQNGKWLYEVKQHLLTKFKTEITIVRPGGLIGGDRHPSISLSRQNKIINDGPINLIHRDDLIQIILKASNLDDSYQIINAVTPFHPNKSDYYNAWAEKLNLPPIQFSKDFDEVKIITSDILPDFYPSWVCPKLDYL